MKEFNGRCLYVAAGPTARKAMYFRDYGPLVTANWAIELFESVDIAFFGSSNKARDTREFWPRAELLVPLIALADAERLGMPEGKWTSFHIPDAPRENDKSRPGLSAYIQQGNVLGRITKGLHYLSEFYGIKEVWLFGHDGGHDYHRKLHRDKSERNHDRDRFVLEETCKYLGMRYYFWPDRPKDFKKGSIS